MVTTSFQLRSALRRSWADVEAADKRVRKLFFDTLSLRLRGAVMLKNAGTDKYTDTSGGLKMLKPENGALACLGAPL